MIDSLISVFRVVRGRCKSFQLCCVGLDIIKLLQEILTSLTASDRSVYCLRAPPLMEI